jgi:pilus assembly protein CpaD
MLKPIAALRFASVAIVMLAGSCAAPLNDDEMRFADPVANHPIQVEPRAFMVSLEPPSLSAGLSPGDAGRLGTLVADFLEKGNGAISIAVPSGPNSSRTLDYLGEKLAAMGVPRSRIIVGANANDGKVTVGYMGYAAKLENCADWSHNVGYTTSNEPTENFGCAVQRNIAAQISDPHDMIRPRAETDADAVRRTTVLGKYEKGESTAATKTEAQSGSVSDVGKK